MAEQTAKHSQIEGLATLLVLNDELRKISNIREFGFYSTNETHHLIPYHTAFLWQPKPLTGYEIVAQSGTAEIDEHSHTNQWLVKFISETISAADAHKIHAIDIAAHKAERAGAELNLLPIDETDELAEHVLWCPFLTKSSEITGGLLLFRETPFTQEEMKMIGWLIASYQYTWYTLQKKSRIAILKKIKDKPIYTAIAILFCMILLFPTRLTVIGTGTVAPKDPVLINSPMQGVIKSFAVSPGEHVKAGQLLITLDQADLKADLEVNKRDYNLTQAKIRSAINEGFNNPAARSEVPLLRAQLAIDQAHFDYSSSLLAKTEIKSPADGIVIFDSKEDWIGQPIQTGERILVVANPNNTELKISLPVTNFMTIEAGDKGNFYIFGQLNPVPIKIKTIGYNAELMPNKSLGYTFYADFMPGSEKQQLGSQGTVEIYGKRVPFIYYLLRRPLQAARRSLGI